MATPAIRRRQESLVTSKRADGKTKPRRPTTTFFFAAAMAMYALFVLINMFNTRATTPTSTVLSTQKNDVPDHGHDTLGAKKHDTSSTDDGLTNNNNHDVRQLLKRPLPPNAKVHRGTDGTASSLDTCPHTMVSAYFSIKSKYPAEKYLTWMANFLSVQDCMVIFTSSDMLEPIRNFRRHAPTKTVLIEVMSLNDLPIAKLGTKLWEHQLDIDREKKIHRSYQLFWIWLSKSWCVVQAIQHDFFSSIPPNNSNNAKAKALFMWQDIGSFRNAKYNDKTILVHTEIVPPQTILWLAHHRTKPPPNPIWNDKFNDKQYYFHSGSQGVGEAQAWLDYHEKFAETIHLFLERDMFIGEDQCVLQSTCQQYPRLCAYIPHTQVKDNFYFGLRYAMVNGGTYSLWRMPSTTGSMKP
ncbi:hypothetical protein ACA910_002412 [Epithemia clementina (nom. ined.)]